MIPKKRLNSNAFSHLEKNERMVALQACEVQRKMAEAVDGLSSLVSLVRYFKDHQIDSSSAGASNPDLDKLLRIECAFAGTSAWLCSLRSMQLSLLQDLRQLLPYDDGRAIKR